ncbi:SDR family NAD(P)-dependent oxidoreductase [Lutibaculum baratangense]|uniref:Oxidoreductase, short-chain dehydrogenase/reductase family n=1 Tax=Lutibaculum baratangense AMV1 TaxID=631454 RepID=V4RK75_9HYPH|nr:SDR family NAD(P)-dependent oxidoreductase [Lutibaculum baratangense]ESR25734.1 Oxidoreductase, short-chain dehydrogenase/reductase family [Lutibaculum baratangense AMV1]
MSSEWRTAWITGASSGIGREMARQLATGGTAVAASARGAESLQALSAETAGKAKAYPLDVADAEAVAARVREIEAEMGEIDLAVLCAGVWKPFRMSEWEVQNFRQGIDVNYMGVVNALAVLVPMMKGRGRGHIAIVASIAGYVGLIKAETYGPTKAALINLAEALRTELHGTGVTVSVVNPGFVDTPMTKDNTFPMPFLLPVETAARRALDGLRTKRFEIVFPRRLAYTLKLMRILPYPLFFWIMQRTVARRQ